MKVLPYTHNFITGCNLFGGNVKYNLYFSSRFYRGFYRGFKGHSVHIQCFTFDLNKLTLGND